MSFWHKLGKMQSCRSLFPRRAPASGAPPRLRRGVTLIELMIAMLILAIVCVSWLQIIGIQSAKREARRREAVERLSGMMDAFMYIHKSSDTVEIGGWKMQMEDGKVRFLKNDPNGTYVYPVFDTDVSPIGYQLLVKTIYPPFDDFWFGDYVTDWLGYEDKAKSPTKKSSSIWLFGILYDNYGNRSEIRKPPFFTLPVCLGK